MWSRMMAYDTEWKAVDKNLAEAVVSDCNIFIVAICVIHIILRIFFSALVGVLASFKLVVATEYVFIGLQSYYY